MSKRTAAAAGLSARKGGTKKAKLPKPQAQAVRQLIKQEYRKQSEAKHWLTNWTSTVDSAGIVLDISAVGQGVGDDQRVGDDISPSSLEARLKLIYADTTNLVRVLFVQYHPDTAVAGPGVSFFFDSAHVAAGLGTVLPYLTTNRSLFRVLSDRTYSLNSGGANACVNVKHVFTKPMRKIHYNGSATTGSERIFCILISDSAVGPHPSYQLVTQLNYRDS
jgi:hypothetical protein